MLYKDLRTSCHKIADVMWGIEACITYATALPEGGLRLQPLLAPAHAILPLLFKRHSRSRDGQSGTPPPPPPGTKQATAAPASSLPP